MQQILALQQQKQALEAQTTSPSIQPTQNIPNTVIPPPSTLSLPLDNQTLQNPPPNLTTNTNITCNSPILTQTNSFPPLTNTVNPPPPPIISQEFNIPPLNPIIPPNLSIPSSLPANVPPINPNVPPPSLNQSNGIEQLSFNQPPPGLPTFLPGGFPDFSKPPPGFPPAIPPKPDVEELMPSVPYYDLPAGLMIPLIKVILANIC